MPLHDTISVPKIPKRKSTVKIWKWGTCRIALLTVSVKFVDETFDVLVGWMDREP